MVPFMIRPETVGPDVRWPRVESLRELNVFRKVDVDGSRPARASKMESLVENARKVRDVFYEVVVLGAGPSDADCVTFLERVVTDQLRRHLSADADDRDRVAERVGETGYTIGDTGTRRDDDDADLASRASVAFRGVHSALLVSDKEVLQFLADLFILERVIDWQNCSARVSEHMLHALIDQCLNDHFSAGHFLGGCRHGLSSLSLFSPLRTAQKKKAPGGAPSSLASVSTYACAEDPAQWARTTTTTAIRLRLSVPRLGNAKAALSHFARTTSPIDCEACGFI